MDIVLLFLIFILFIISANDTAEEFIEKLTFFIIIVSLIVSERHEVRETTAFVD